MKNAATKLKLSPKKIILGVIIILAGVLGVLVYQNRITISDWFSGLSYTPSAEVSSIEESIGLTDSGKLILRATHPSLEQKDSFNEKCDSHDQEISILGCYTKNRIYLYDINEESLNGVKESTLAHELLHAVWERMSDSERNRISKYLTEVYDNEQYHSLLADDLTKYAESERMDELHSRIGTEIVELPAELEEHYAKYFKDQDALVMYFNDYITPFRELSEKIEELSTKLEELNQEIEEKTKTYYADAENLSHAIDEFNDCVKTSGCFASISAANSSRNELVAKKDELENVFNSINTLISQYNTLVSEYNDNILRGQNLENIINSNAKVEEIK